MSHLCARINFELGGNGLQREDHDKVRETELYEGVSRGMNLAVACKE
jgi:hypothetical protein